MRLIKPAYTLFLKTGVVCNAGCITCPAGRKLPEDKESSGNMTADMLDRIFNRVKEQGNIISATFHFYNEPCLNQEMPDLIRVANKHKVNCLMSTNGSYIKPLREIVSLGLRNLIFSVSGWTQSVHERSHKNVNIETVKANMMEVSRIRSSKTFVRVSWHDYWYNEHEKELMKDYAESLGFTFTPYNTGVLPLERTLRRFTQLAGNPSAPEDIAERDIKTKLVEAKELCKERKHFKCINQERMITIDSNGDLHNCCVKAHDANRRTNIFNTCLEEFNTFRKEKDLDCKACKAIGGHVYAMQRYRRPVNEPAKALLQKLEDGWRYVGLGGVFPIVSAKWSQWNYNRPVKHHDSKH